MPEPSTAVPAIADDPELHAALHTPVVRRFARGIALGFPIFLGYMPVGMAFGVLARTTGFSAVDAIVCSATALAGAGQFIALSVVGTGASAVSTVLATAVVNLRYVLFGTTLSPHLRTASPGAQTWLAFTLTDETFAVNIADRRKGLSTVASMAGVGAIAWTGWVLGTVVGAYGASWIGDPTTWGMDFAMPAMFAALFVALAEDKRHVMVGLGAAVLALAIPLIPTITSLLSPSWITIIASILAATAAAVLLDD